MDKLIGNHIDSLQNRLSREDLIYKILCLKGDETTPYGRGLNSGLEAACGIIREQRNKHPDVAGGWPCPQISVEELGKRTKNPLYPPDFVDAMRHNAALNNDPEEDKRIQGAVGLRTKASSAPKE